LFYIRNEKERPQVVGIKELIYTDAVYGDKLLAVGGVDFVAQTTMKYRPSGHLADNPFPKLYPRISSRLTIRPALRYKKCRISNSLCDIETGVCSRNASYPSNETWRSPICTRLLGDGIAPSVLSGAE
jgi:hypothetical protein